MIPPPRPPPSRAPDARRPRLLLLTDIYAGPRGGTEGQILALAHGLGATWDVELWVLQESRWLETHDFPCPTRSLRLGSLARPRTLARLHGLAREARRRRFDGMHAWMNDASLVAPWLGARAGVPVLLSRRDLGLASTPVRLALQRRLDRRAAAIVANSEAVKRHVVEAEAVPSGLVEVVANGVDAAALAVPPLAGLRERLGIPPGSPLVGLVANLRAVKRVDDLLAALARLPPRHADVHALFVGAEDPAGPPFAARARAHGVETRAHRLEGEDVPGLLGHLDVGVLCSASEGLSNAVLEYMAAALPVVATRAGGNPEVVVDGETGLLYEPGDVDALARSLGLLLSDPARRKRMGARGKERVERAFGVPRMVAETEALYVRARAGRPAAVPSGLAWEAIGDLAGLRAIAADWDGLLGRDHLFLSPTWVTTWFETAAGRARPLVLAARDGGGRLVGVLPLARQGLGVLEIAGQRMGGDHLDVVARDGDRDRVASGALDRLAAMGWRRLRWRNLAEDGALRRAVWARREELRFRERVANVCPYARIAGTYEEHLLAVMTTRRRRDVRRCTRAFRDLPDGSVDRIRTPERAGEGVERFLALHARGARRRGGASSVDCEAGRRFHRTLAPRLAADGRLALVFLRQGGRDLACQYDFLLGDKVYGYQGGIDPDSPVPSPGNVLRGIVLAEDVIGAGRTEYDLLEGEEEYKRNWANARRRLFDVEVHRPGPVGRASALLLDAGDALRETWRARREAAVPPAGTQSPEEPSSAV